MSTSPASASAASSSSDADARPSRRPPVTATSPRSWTLDPRRLPWEFGIVRQIYFLLSYCHIVVLFIHCQCIILMISISLSLMTSIPLSLYRKISLSLCPAVFPTSLYHLSLYPSVFHTSVIYLSCPYIPLSLHSSVIYPSFLHPSVPKSSVSIPLFYIHLSSNLSISTSLYFYPSVLHPSVIYFFYPPCPLSFIPLSFIHLVKTYLDSYLCCFLRFRP